MNQELHQLSEKDLAVLKTLSDYNEMNNINYSKVVLNKVSILLKLINSLFEEKVKVSTNLIWIEPLIQKLTFHSVNILKLFEGTVLPMEQNDELIKILDKPSIISLLRVITENYLTFHYLYSDNIPEEEKQFRLSVWRYCGIKQRVEFELLPTKVIEKQKREMLLLEELKNEIITSKVYTSFSNQKQKEILKGHKPRLFNSWIDLIKNSGLKFRLFKNMYGYKSNYSHSEFISILQVHSGIYQYNSAAELESELILLHIIICKAIINLKNIFSTIETNYKKLESKVIYEIEFIDSFGSDENIDK
jgi:Family of unknown function (DUF5677)